MSAEEWTVPDPSERPAEEHTLVLPDAHTIILADGFSVVVERHTVGDKEADCAVIRFYDDITIVVRRGVNDSQFVTIESYGVESLMNTPGKVAYPIPVGEPRQRVEVHR